MTQPGSVSARRIVVLAASAFVVLAAEPLFILVDTAVVGHVGSIPLAALGAGGTVMTLLALIGSSLEYGTTGRAARFFGAGQRAAAVNEGVQASWLGFGLGLIGIVVGEALAGPLATVLAGHGQVARAAESWLRIAVLGLPGILLVLAGNGWMRGVQDTKSPVRIVVLANVLSAIASPLLVFPAGLGLEGSAIANVAAQWVGAALFLRALRREHVPLRAQKSVMRRQLVVSRDVVLRAAAFQAAYLTAAGVAGRMGAAQLAAHQVGLQLWEFVALLLDSFAIAAQSLVGAALGGEDAGQARDTASRVMRYGLVTGIVFAGLIAAGWFAIPAVFTSDPLVRNQIHILWPWLIGMLPVGGVLFALDGVLFGSGDFAFLRTVTLVAALCGFVPIALLALLLHWGIGGVWAGLACFIAMRFVGMIWRIRGDKWLITGVTH